MKKFILPFSKIGMKDVPKVGGKNAALGEMYSNLTKLGISVPDGFALTAGAYRFFLKKNGADEKIKDILKRLNIKNVNDLRGRAGRVRALILSLRLPKEITKEIRSAYHRLEGKYGKNVDVAVRSSATAEDLPGASFAGQQETYLNVRGEEGLEAAAKKCIASLFTDRAISYRADKRFSHFDVALSVGVQKMVRSDLASSGVAFTIDTETGFDKVVVIESSYGLGEMVVQGEITPDEFVVFKPTLGKGFQPVIAKDLGVKNVKLVYGKEGTRKAKVSNRDKNSFSLNEEEIIKLARWCVSIEKHFSRIYKHYQPMDIEWAKDGKTKELFILQARPETVHSLISGKKIYPEYRLKGKGKIVVSGIAVGTKAVSGKARFIKDVKDIGKFRKGEVLVTEITDPAWEPIMKIAAAIVTDKGGRTSHAAIVSRELGIPCIVGAALATKKLKTGKVFTVDCTSGGEARVYAGKIPYEIVEHHLDKIPKTRTKVMVNIGSPDEAFKNHYLPVKGVGLGRLEFIIASHIKIHPQALIDYKKLKDEKTRRRIDSLTRGYRNKAQFYVDELAEGIAKIAAAFYPEEAIIRFSDFKTNEYRKLIGGELYEPDEENPMLGWRGASRYYDPKFERAFGLECKALKRVREKFGLKNAVPMIPFCRSTEEGKKVLSVMAKNGLRRGKDGLKVYVMCEIPSNVLLADEFLDIFDGMSIGSNDLTQLVLGLDRDSGIVTHIANENNPAVKKMISEVIERCRKRKKYIGICGQAPSDYPEFTKFLVKEGIGSISLNPDTVIKTILEIKRQESK
ncbi:MAG: Phosphoenolpyruvate synthase [Candidatus Jorgensenbacteria bacterium GW2011_GWA1_48_13]|uniref:Phosphoenolpyruvate synthase n=2 Tax=Candidatus Joergenseniibacteriota TaxID=1752739 RepID=A0A0G1YK74_9BACT|nr:MAG: Phosphoenolpyruvate synthase [Candidatus Jorgensenbacteria bacterium GW2011_GWA1_48_13]KKU99222.1 MAG: Phosphoenolpyruvate synthase [Candidatus Jorgensenbacteria bacterium GW2011_GWC1_48_8]KKW15417.1 MAG: Phosphoenolpyruvate synthase [Candidatus Jorgensenbacteria bacterium GW2011_GWB1_50_10]